MFSVAVFPDASLSVTESSMYPGLVLLRSIVLVGVCLVKKTLPSAEGIPTTALLTGGSGSHTSDTLTEGLKRFAGDA